MYSAPFIQNEFLQASGKTIFLYTQDGLTVVFLFHISMGPTVFQYIYLIVQNFKDVCESG